jgi:hypothetical protein
MSSRALILATVLLPIGLLAAGRAQAQENLDAGKTPSQIFAGTCNACHKSPRGLLKTVSPSSLPSFLRQHYTTSPNMAGVLASYLVSNGATDTRIGGDSPKGAKGAKEGAKQEARQEPRPGGSPEQLDRWGRRIHPNAGPQEAAAPASEPRQEGKPEAEQAATERGGDGRRNAKQKLTKRGRPSEELPRETTSRETPKEEPAASEAAREPPKSETAAKEEGKPEAKEANKPDTARPADEGRSQSAKVEQPADTPAIRPDPVPPVTPAPPTTAISPATTAPATAVPAAAPAPAQAAVALPPTEMAVPLPATAMPPPAVTASTTPPLPPVAPAGPPAPPISQ